MADDLNSEHRRDPWDLRTQTFLGYRFIEWERALALLRYRSPLAVPESPYDMVKRLVEENRLLRHELALVDQGRSGPTHPSSSPVVHVHENPSSTYRPKNEGGSRE